MTRISNARTIADIEFVIDAPSIGSEINAWVAHGVECQRDRHRFNGQGYSFSLDVLSLRLVETRHRWHVVIISELWGFAGTTSEARRTQSLKVLKGKPSDVLAWMRRHRSAKLEPDRPPLRISD
ncbi:MAG: hypothetical protein IJ127_06890 [Afipia sp.]|nr:hypothetical protein [Afipia sp.]MBQ8102615.1 hypothetical protein [Afipia sp.]